MGIVRFALVVALLAAAGSADAKPSNKWRVKCNGSADSAGEVVINVEPVGGAPIEVVVAIPDGTSENSVAVLVRDALRLQLKDTHRVERDDWEDVIVKKRYGQPDFELILLDNTVEDMKIKLQRE